MENWHQGTLILEKREICKVNFTFASAFRLQACSSQWHREVILKQNNIRILLTSRDKGKNSCLLSQIKLCVLGILEKKKYRKGSPAVCAVVSL